MATQRWRRPTAAARALCLALAATCAGGELLAQTLTPPARVAPRRPRRSVRADLAATSFDSVLPFDQQFLVRVKEPTKPFDSLVVRFGTYTCMRLSAASRKILQCETASTVVPNALFENADAVIEVTHGLTPDAPYEFDFTAYRTEVVRDRDGKPVRTLDFRDSVVATVDDQHEVVGWTTTDFRDHFDTDFGTFYAPRTGYVGLGTLVHVFAEPIHPHQFAADSDVTSASRRCFKRVEERDRGPAEEGDAKALRKWLNPIPGDTLVCCRYRKGNVTTTIYVTAESCASDSGGQVCD